MEDKKESKKFVLTEMEVALLQELAVEHEDVQLAMRVNRGNAALRMLENKNNALVDDGADR